MRPQPLIAVNDVPRSSRWYQRLLGYESGHGGAHYEQLLRDGELVMQLHAWDDDEHPNLQRRSDAPLGHGVLLWFATDDFDGAVARAGRLGAEVVSAPQVNPSSQAREIWLRDLDGYIVVIAEG